MSLSLGGPIGKYTSGLGGPDSTLAAKGGPLINLGTYRKF